MIQNGKVFVANLLTWYGLNKRDLPWRNTTNPYIIWLSEIILQQTRVRQGLPYFLKFFETYPDVQKLASADEQAVLRLWQGLGYYSRAKNLHACAKYIVSDYDGYFPNNFKSLLNLRGVGTYTAAAIASFAYDEKVAVVDGNVYRVLSRVFGLDPDIASPQGQRFFRQFAHELLPDKDSATYNQAIMDFGALQCRPINPSCDVCVCKNYCFAYKHQMQKQLPVKISKVKIKNRYLNYFVIRCGDKLLMKRRSSKDIWNGLYDFYLVETESEMEVNQLQDGFVSWLLLRRTNILDISRDFKHILTHQRLYSKFYLVDLTDLEAESILKENLKSEKYSLYSLEEVIDLPKPILINKYLSENIFFD